MSFYLTLHRGGCADDRKVTRDVKNLAEHPSRKQPPRAVSDQLLPHAGFLIGVGKIEELYSGRGRGEPIVLYTS